MMPTLHSLCVAVLCLGLALSGCTTVLDRSPVPEALIDTAQPYGIDAPDLRQWGDFIVPEQISGLMRERAQVLRTVYGEDIRAGRTIETATLALSGGGPDGAFGAGLLKGWSERGDRPEFSAVTGISTGAIIAIFAFLGADYDGALEEIYTTYTTVQLLSPAIGAAILGGSALSDARGYRQLIDQYLNTEILARLAEAYNQGRTLLIGTTNLDASRPVTWNIGAIAASGHPSALRLIRDIVQASSAIPAAFPPVLIPVEAGGERYDEMHVDGGATQQVMLYSPQVSLRMFDRMTGARFKRALYVIINNKLRKPYAPVSPRILSIAPKAASSLISGSGTGDLYKIFAIAQRDGITMNITGIPQDFNAEPAGLFDPVYMRALFDLGYEIGKRGGDWSPYPPDYAPFP
ncbi:MAG: patatin-like phospholipase family protein [Pseudomonadota bacterium]